MILKENNMQDSTMLFDHLLLDHLRVYLSGKARTWFQNTLQALAQGDQDFFTLSAMAKRNVGDANLPAPFMSWSCDEAARVLLLKHWLQTHPGKKREMVGQAYRFGDDDEKIAIMKGLSLLDKTGELVALAITAGRTNSLALFAAVALRNAYAAAHYDERAFNQLVLKALFLGLDLRQMSGLPTRLNATLSHLCLDLAVERLAAHRPLPKSIRLAVAFNHLSEQQRRVFLNNKVDDDEIF